MVAQSRKRSNGCASRVEDGYTKAVLDMRRGDAPRWGTAWVRLVRSAICGAAPPLPLAEAVRAALQRRPSALQDRPASCANACASTTPASVSPSKLSNSAASPSAAPPAGTCHPDPHRRLPTPSHPATVPHPGRTRNERPLPTLRAICRAQLTSARGAQRNTVFVVFVGLLTVQRKEDSLGRS